MPNVNPTNIVQLRTDPPKPLSLQNGGTGQTTQINAFNSLSPLITKGDFVVHNGKNSVRQPVGKNNSILVTDLTQSTGVKWIDLSPQQIIYVSTSGNDITGNGNVLFPFATIYRANLAITNNSSLNRYLVQLDVGLFIETNNVLLKPFVYYVGKGSATRITSPNNEVQLDNSFSLNTARTSVSSLTLAGSTKFNLDLMSIGGVFGAVVEINNCVVATDLIFKGRMSGADYIHSCNSYYVGDIFLFNCLGIANNNSASNLSFNVSDSANNIIFKSNNLYLKENLSILAENNILTSFTLLASNILGTLTVSGNTATLVTDSVSLPTLQSNLFILDNATVNELTDSYSIKYSPTESDWAILPHNVSTALTFLAQNKLNNDGTTQYINFGQQKVNQLINTSTHVTLNSPSGVINMFPFNDILPHNTVGIFALNNTSISVDSTIIVSIAYYTGSPGIGHPVVNVINTIDGQSMLMVYNIGSGLMSGTVGISFLVC